LWTTAPDPALATEVASAPVSAPSRLINHPSALTPEVVARAKSQGFAPALFPLGVEILSASRRSAHAYLTEEIEHAIDRFAAREPTRQDVIARLVVGALAVLMIRDKAMPSGLTDIGPGAMIDVAQQRYPGYFQWLNQLTDAELTAFSIIIEQLGTNINFASLEPSMVSGVYEQALVNKFTRREQGTFYTPPQLAHQMVNAIPFEQISPERRTILDPACGSGTLLLAAAARLTQLQPDPSDTSACHEYLISHLQGYDDDPLASEITRLCLLMSAMPVRNSWKVENIDTLQMRLSGDEKPSVIISNPPWKFKRSPEDTAERANTFLSWMLDNLADDGFLACVVPLSWIDKKNSRYSRSALLHRADLVDLWRLPSNMFKSTSSTIAPAVILAKKRRKPGYDHHLCLVKTIKDASTNQFLSNGLATESYIIEPGIDGHRLTQGPLTRAVIGNAEVDTISAAAKVYTGRSKLKGRPTRSAGEATHYELGSLKQLRPFARPDLRLLQPVRYPEDYNSSRATDERVRAHKVVVTGKSFSTTNPWRLNVGYDDYGLSLREMFFSVIPNPSWPPWSHLTEWQQMCVIMAVLGSGFGSCWIDENEPTRNISIESIKQFPLPTNPVALQTLAAAGEFMASAVASGLEPTLIAAAAELEDAVNTAYQLTLRERRLIAKRLANAPAREDIIRYPAEDVGVDLGAHDADRGTPSFGHVIEANEDGLTLWVSGSTALSGVSVEAPLQIPGWLCRAGSDFVISGDIHNPGRAIYSFHRADWLTTSELTSRPGPMI
jgi:predicted RNA methylase